MQEVNSGSSFAMEVDANDRRIVASFAFPVRACSWAIVGGGLIDVRHVVWFEVCNAELGPTVSPQSYAEGRLRSSGITNATVMLTSRRVSSYCDAVAVHGGVWARCLATVGLGNALRAGDPPAVPCRLGTINLLVYVETSLNDIGLIEANSIATEARAAAVSESGITSRCSGLPATGTGTDCNVLACPKPSSGRLSESFAGKHTAIGAVVGETVYQSVSQGISIWLAEQT